MAKTGTKTSAEEAAERMARLGIKPGAASRVAVPPASVASVVNDEVDVAPEPAPSMKKGKDQRLCILVSREQAYKVKHYALENDTTVSDLLRGYIDSL